MVLRNSPTAPFSEFPCRFVFSDADREGELLSARLSWAALAGETGLRVPSSPCSETRAAVGRKSPCLAALLSPPLAAGTESHGEVLVFQHGLFL